MIDHFCRDFNDRNLYLVNAVRTWLHLHERRRICYEENRERRINDFLNGERAKGAKDRDECFNGTFAKFLIAFALTLNELPLRECACELAPLARPWRIGRELSPLASFFKITAFPRSPLTLTDIQATQKKLLHLLIAQKDTQKFLIFHERFLKFLSLYYCNCISRMIIVLLFWNIQFNCTILCETFNCTIFPTYLAFTV